MLYAEHDLGHLIRQVHILQVQVAMTDTCNVLTHHLELCTRYVMYDREQCNEMEGLISVWYVTSIVQLEAFILDIVLESFVVVTETDVNVDATHTLHRGESLCDGIEELESLGTNVQCVDNGLDEGSDSVVGVICVVAAALVVVRILLMIIVGGGGGGGVIGVGGCF